MNKLIDTNYIYISTHKFINYDSTIIIGYMGFYSDGRMIIDNTDLGELDSTLFYRNSFGTASAIGYYTTDANTITMECFLPFDGGMYEVLKGRLLQDTIIRIEKVNMLFKQQMRFDTLVKSSYPLRR